MDADGLVRPSMIDELLKRRKEHDEVLEAIKQHEEEYREAVNIVMNTQAGRIFHKYLKLICRADSYDVSGNGYKLIEDNGRRRVYFECIRPFMEKETIAKLEE